MEDRCVTVTPLSPHLMKTMERMILGFFCTLVRSTLDSLQLRYHPGIQVGDAIVYLLHQVTNFRSEHNVKKISCVSDVGTSSTGEPQGTMLSPFFFTLYIADFKYNSSLRLCRSSATTPLVSCMSERDNQRWRRVILEFVDLFDLNNLLLNSNRTKELVVYL